MERSIFFAGANEPRYRGFESELARPLAIGCGSFDPAGFIDSANLMDSTVGLAGNDGSECVFWDYYLRIELKFNAKFRLGINLTFSVA